MKLCYYETTVQIGPENLANLLLGPLIQMRSKENSVKPGVKVH